MILIFFTRRLFVILVLIFSCGVISSVHGNSEVIPQDDSLISLNFYQTEIGIILQSLADYRQMNLIMDGGIEHEQTIKLNKVSWDKALKIITQFAKLDAEIEGNLLFIKHKPDSTLLYQQKLQQLKEDELLKPLAYLPIKINHSDITALQTILNQQGILSDRGQAFMDERTNTLIIHDIKDKFNDISLLVAQFDRALPQVHISAHIVTMSSESASELGIKWGYTGSSSELIDQVDINLGVANAPSSIGFNLAKRSGNLLNLELSALEAENQLEIIASPNLLTSHQHTASIKQGTEIPYEVSNGNNNATSIEFKQAVLGLEVTPRVLMNNQLELELYITQNTAGRSIKRSDGGEALAIDTQEIRTQVLVNSGETLVLGGIFQQSHHQDKSEVSGVSKMPLIGRLFQYDGQRLQRRELVIFITPQLINSKLQ